MLTAVLIIALLLWLVNSDHLGLTSRTKVRISRVLAVILIVVLIVLIFDQMFPRLRPHF
jgi:hypothetical protein